MALVEVAKPSHLRYLLKAGKEKINIYLYFSLQQPIRFQAGYCVVCLLGRMFRLSVAPLCPWKQPLLRRVPFVSAFLGLHSCAMHGGSDFDFPVQPIADNATTPKAVDHLGLTLSLGVRDKSPYPVPVRMATPSRYAEASVISANLFPLLLFDIRPLADRASCCIISRLLMSR